MMLLIALGLLLGIAGVGYLEWKGRSDLPVEQVVLTDEAREYLTSLDLSDVEMGATDNSLGQTLVEITGTIRNIGDRPVRSIRLNCVFFDIYGIELHRVLSTIVRSSQGLQPGVEVPFRLPFDDIPDGWNQVLPSLYVAEIVFD
ncbi:MAG: FxLYD domain-containing protein [Bryobacterales bacterium]|nr:FxLYD domain-containing protein [Bryobacterales bacterium]